MARTKKEVLDTNSDVNDVERQLSEYGLSDLVRLAEHCSTDLVTTSTGYPGLDETLNPKNPGLAHGIDIELFSDAGSAGKTTAAIQILAAWQRAGLRTQFIDVETAPGLEAYMNELGLKTRKEQCLPNEFPVYIVRGQVDSTTGIGNPLTLQDVFNILEKSAKYIFDITAVDSVDALVQKADMEKTSDDNVQVGGISKKMSEFMRKMVLKKATIIWLNQTRESMGYSPTGAPPKKTSGGRAMLFYADIRIKITQIGKLTEKKGDQDIAWGFKSKFETIKNKTSSMGMWRDCTLNCVFGEGFSILYDYFEVAKKRGIIVKNSAWFISEPLGLKIQGEKKMYEAIRDTEGIADKLRILIDGEDIEETGLDEQVTRIE